jgi:hypothetical protein
MFLLIAMVWGPLLAWESQTDLLREKWRAQRRQTIVRQGHERAHGDTMYAGGWPKKSSPTT